MTVAVAGSTFWIVFLSLLLGPGPCWAQDRKWTAELELGIGPGGTALHPFRGRQQAIPYIEAKPDQPCIPSCAIRITRSGDWRGIDYVTVYLVAGKYVETGEPPVSPACMVPSNSPHHPWRHTLRQVNTVGPVEQIITLDMSKVRPAFYYKRELEGLYMFVVALEGGSEWKPVGPFFFKPAKLRNRSPSASTCN